MKRAVGSVVATFTLIFWLSGLTAAEEPRRTHFVAGIDTYWATFGGSSKLAAWDVAESLNLESYFKGQSSLRVDMVNRDSMLGAKPRRELHELAFTLPKVAGLIQATVGRQRIPGGFWLIADGVKLGFVHEHGSLSFIGGTRAFSNARSEMVLTRHPIFLPLAGVVAEWRADRWQSSISAVLTRDRVSVHRGLIPDDDFADEGNTTGIPIKATDELPELFIDANLWARFSRATLFATATAGNQYTVGYSRRPDLLINDPTFESQLLGSQGFNLGVDIAASRLWRILVWSTAYRAKTVFETGDANQPSASFLELAERIDFRPRKRWKFWLINRQRIRDEALLIRETLGMQVPVVAGFFWHASGGVELRTGAEPPPGYIARKRWFGNASIKWIGKIGELEGGAQVSDFFAGNSPQRVRELSSPELQLFPYALEAQTYGFLRGFATLGHYFAGVDFEMETSGKQMRAFVQAGYAL